LQVIKKALAVGAGVRKEYQQHILATILLEGHTAAIDKLCNKCRSHIANTHKRTLLVCRQLLIDATLTTSYHNEGNNKYITQKSHINNV
jgi:hypothetical protein